MELLPEKCPLCKAPDRASFETQVLKGKLTKRDLAQILGCRVDDVWEHFTSHMHQGALRELDEKRNVLLDSVNKLRESLDFICATKNYGPTMTKQLTELAKELRQTIGGLAELEGGQKKEQHITIEQYNDFRSVVISNIDKLCPACKQIMVDELSKSEEDESKPPVIEAEYRTKSVQRPRVLRREDSEDQAVPETG